MSNPYYPDGVTESDIDSIGEGSFIGQGKSDYDLEREKNYREWNEKKWRRVMNDEIKAIEEAQDIIHRYKQRVLADMDLMDRDLFQLKMRTKNRIEDELADQAKLEESRAKGA